MKAIIYTKAGGLDVLERKEIPIPEPNDNQVLIQVKAVALNVSEYERFRTLDDKVPLFIKFTNAAMGYTGKPLGAEISGVVVKTGKNITHVKCGDAVFGKTAGTAPAGGTAEYALMDKDRVFQKPKNLSFEQSASISISFETALGAVRRANIKSGQQVMIYGASGGVGLFAVQLSKILGADVTGVCSTRNVTLAKQMGCNTVIDYKREDFTQSSVKYDAILGINGCNPMKSYQNLLKKNGVFVGVGNTQQAMKALLRSFTSKQFTYFMGPMMPQKDYLSYAKELAETGKLTPYIDKIYSVGEIKEAIRYGVTEHPQGKVVLTVDF